MPLIEEWTELPHNGPLAGAEHLRPGDPCAQMIQSQATPFVVRWACTRDRGHDGNHEAAAGVHLVAIWKDEN